MLKYTRYLSCLGCGKVLVPEFPGFCGSCIQTQKLQRGRSRLLPRTNRCISRARHISMLPWRDDDSGGGRSSYLRIGDYQIRIEALPNGFGYKVTRGDDDLFFRRTGFDSSKRAKIAAVQRLRLALGLSWNELVKTGRSSEQRSE